MKTIKDNEELKSYINNGQITFDCDIKCEFNIDINASLTAWNIDARNINALNITAGNINALNITAADIEYYASCIAHESFKCVSLIGRRSKAIHKCLDGEIEFIKNNLKGKEVSVIIDGKTYKATIN